MKNPTHPNIDYKEKTGFYKKGHKKCSSMNIVVTSAARKKEKMEI